MFLKRHRTPDGGERPPDRRWPVDLEVQLTLDEDRRVEARARALSVAGVVVVLADPKAAPAAGEGLEVEIVGPQEAWRVATAGLVDRVREEEGRALCELSFINLGDLYSQLDNAFAHYFNRRERPRAKPELDESIHVAACVGPRRVHGQMHDLSTRGLGLALAPRSARQLEDGERVRLEFKLPGVRRSFRGAATVAGRARLAGAELVRFELVQEGGEGFLRYRRALERFIELRTRQLARWAASWPAA